MPAELDEARKHLPATVRAAQQHLDEAARKDRREELPDFTLELYRCARECVSALRMLLTVTASSPQPSDEAGKVGACKQFEVFTHTIPARAHICRNCHRPREEHGSPETVPSADELDCIARNDLREGICAVFGSQVREAVAMAIDAGYRRGLSDGEKAREAEVAALRGFVDSVRAYIAGGPLTRVAMFDRIKDLESELARVVKNGAR